VGWEGEEEGAIAAGSHLRSIFVPRSLLFRLSFASRDLRSLPDSASDERSVLIAPVNLKMIANRLRGDESIFLADAADAHNGDPCGSISPVQ
jgi:hypothetical protein